MSPEIRIGDESPAPPAGERADLPSPDRAGLVPWLAERAAFAAIFLLLLALCTTRITDTDLWWHLASGDLIRQTGAIPRAEPFSFTAIGHPWIDVHWLFQVVLSLLYETGDLRLLEFVRDILILGAFALVFRRCRRVARPAIVAAVLLLAALACQERFLPRPEIVSWLLMLAVLAIVQRALDARGRRGRAVALFVWLPLLQIVWASVQGLFVLGPVLVGLGLAATLVERWRGGAATDPDRPLDFLLALAAVSVASLANPYGAGALRLALDQFFLHLGGKSLLSRTIAEFRPPLSGYLVTPSIVAFVVLAALTLLALVGDVRRARTFDVLVIAATLVLALRARRNIPLFALAGAPVLARHSAGLLFPMGTRLRAVALSWTRRGPVRHRVALVVTLALLAAIALALTVDVATNRFFLRWPTERWFGSGDIPDYFPEESASYLAGGGIPGNVFHSLSAGGYLIHAWRGGRGVFIDGRNDPYLDDVLPAYLGAIADPARFEEVARRYQITAVLWPHQRALEGKTLLSYLARGRGWTLVHLDPGGAVYLRADLLTPARLTEGPFPAGRDRRETYRALAQRLDRRPFSGPPLREIALGEFFSVSGDPAGAEFFYRRALDRLPRSAAVLYGYGLSLERQGKSREARAAYASALGADDDYAPARAALGTFQIEEGRLEEAERNLDAAWRAGDRSARLLAARARLFEQKGDIPRAVQAWRDALLLFPRQTDLLVSLARFYVRHDETASALPFYAAAAELEPDDPVIAHEMAAVLERLGRAGAALDVARDAARRALDRLAEAGSGVGAWTAGGGRRDDDRGLLLFAALLETRAGDRARARQYMEALARAGLTDREGDQ